MNNAALHYDVVTLRDFAREAMAYEKAGYREKYAMKHGKKTERKDHRGR